MVGVLGIGIGVLGIFLAVFIPYAYEKWKEPHIEIRIPEDDPPGKNRRYLHAYVLSFHR
jgi:hypothetical protein